MAKKHRTSSARDDDTAAQVKEKSESSEPDDDFWTQWQSTSVDDVERDTYGTERRYSLEQELRAGPA